MEKKQESEYGNDFIPLMDLVWGKGFIAPGGEGNVDRIVRGVDLQGKRVLELGSGAGGGTLVLARKHGARVVGLELEQGLVDLSREHALAAGLSQQVEFRCVEAGPLAVDDASFDAFYTSGVVCHIEDRKALFDDVMRILKPGGMLLGYDWFVTRDSDDIDAWKAASGLHLHSATLDNYLETLTDCGFVEVGGSDASDWYRPQAARELADLEGPLFAEAARVSSEEVRDGTLAEWRAMNVVLQSGDLQSGYFRGSKPL
jgi:SAM-dependent methyltransferase